MKIAIAQLNYHIGNFEWNTQKIISNILQARILGADLVVFSELCITGYPARDFLEYPGFIENCEKAIEKIAQETHSIDCIIGSPWKNYHKPGKDLINAAIYLSKGRIKHIIPKTLLPTYDIFDEYRYFEPGINENCIELGGIKIALTICEDLWNTVNGQYKSSPMEALALKSPDLMINIAASPFQYAQAEERMKVLRANVKEYSIPLIYVNHIGAQTEILFDGGSMALDGSGNLIQEPQYFEESLEILDWEDLKKKEEENPLIDSLELKSPQEIFKNPLYLERIHKALVLGIQDFFSKSHFKKAVIGLSGGIDSALVTVLAVEALGPENVLAIMMPSEFSSDHSISDSLDLARNLGIEIQKIPIGPLFNEFQKSLSPIFGDLPFSLAEENIQSRTRAVFLMGISNKLGHILLNTSNKSECAVGYGTLYGDMCGAISVIGDLYKTQVFALCHYLNHLENRIPASILKKAPSAELRPNQKDSDSLPDYAILDQILFGYIEERKDYQELIESGFEISLVQKTLSLVNRAEFKRYQSPPILRVSPKAFGMGRRMPIVGKYDY